MGKEKPPRAKARSRCSPSVVPPPLYSLAAAPFPKGGSAEFLSQDAHFKCHLDRYILHMHTRLELCMYQVGIYAVWGFGPSRGSLHSIRSFIPIPLHGLLLRSYGGGWGGKDGSAHHLEGVRVSRLLPIPRKNPW